MRATVGFAGAADIARNRGVQIAVRRIPGVAVASQAHVGANSAGVAGLISQGESGLLICIRGWCSLVIVQPCVLLTSDDSVSIPPAVWAPLGVMQVMMVTGDHTLTACHVAESLGICTRPPLVLTVHDPSEHKDNSAGKRSTAGTCTRRVAQYGWSCARWCHKHAYVNDMRPCVLQARSLRLLLTAGGNPQMATRSCLSYVS